MKKTFRILLFILAFLSIQRFCYVQTAGFRTEKIAARLTPLEEPLPSTEIEGILQGPFRFLGSGVQCYAFESPDKKWVLKVFKHYHMPPSTPLLESLPLPSFLESWRQKIVTARKQRMESIYSSLRLAHAEYREETAMVYLHLHRSTHFEHTLTLIDKIGIAHTIDLDTTPFVLQKKAQLVYPYLEHLLHEGKVEKAKRAIDALLELIENRRQLHISNSDPILHRNMGFVEGRAVEIDLGSFYKNPFAQKGAISKKEFFFETWELEEWLKKHHPPLADYLHEKMAHYIALSS